MHGFGSRLLFGTLVLFLGCATPPPPPPPPPPTAPPVPVEDVSVGEAPPVGELPADLRPTHYALALDLDPTLDKFSGTADIALVLSKGRSVIWLHGRDLAVNEATLIAGGEKLAATWTQVDDTGLVKLALPHAVARGEATLHIAWHAPFDPQLTGVYKSRAAGHDYVFSKFEATYARRAFPSFDQPGFKTPFAIALDVPEKDTAVSNSPEVSTVPAAPGKKHVTFAETKPLPTYLVVFVAGELDIAAAEIPPNSIRTTPLPLRAIGVLGTLPKLQTALHEGATSIGELEKEYGIPYPYAKIDLIAVPDFQSGAMENAAAITFRDNLLLLDEKTASVDLRKSVAEVTAHELAHQWFGDLVTMQWWDDIWLNEGFATFMATRVLEATRPELQVGIDEVRASGGVMAQDELVSARKIRQPIASTHDITNAFDGITYQKGAAVLRMFERWMGKEKFFAGIHAHLLAHAYGNATTSDLLATLSASSGVDVRGPFESFLDRSGVPLVETSVQCVEGKGSVHFKQSRSLPLGSTGSRDEIWKVPVCIRYALQGEVKERCDLLSEREQTVALEGCPTWVLPNADASGYYRWSLAPADLIALREKGFASLSTGERISFAQNLVSALRSGALPADAAIAALVPLAKDPSGAVAEQPMGILEFVHDDVALARHDRKAVASIESVARKLYTPLLEGKKGLGWRAMPGESTETRDLRESVIRFLALEMDDAKTRKHAASLGLKYLGDTAVDPTQVDSDLVLVALVSAAVHGDAKLFARLQARLFASEDSQLRQRLIGALSSFRDPKLAEAARALAFDPRLRQNERAFPYFVQLNDVHNRDAAWGALQAKFDTLAPLLPDRYAGFLVRTVGFCNTPQMESVRSFFATRIESVNGGPRNLASALESMQLCVARVDAQGNSALAYFKKR